MNIKDFREKFESIATEVSSDGVEVNSHNLIARVRIFDEDANEYQIVDLEPGFLNCMCWNEVQIIVRKVEE